MNHANLTPDDPRLTAYALGELEGEERAAVEAALRHDPGLRAMVEEIRQTATSVREALADEPMPSVFSRPPMVVQAGTRPPQSPKAAAIIPGRNPRPLDGGPLQPGRLVAFPRAYFALAGFAAACFALLYFVGPGSPVPTATPARVSKV